MSQSHQFAIRLTLTDLSLLKLQFQYDCSDSQGELACPDRFQAAHCIKASFFPFFFFLVLVKQSSQTAFCFLGAATVMGTQVMLSLFLLGKEKGLGWSKDQFRAVGQVVVAVVVGLRLLQLDSHLWRTRATRDGFHVTDRQQHLCQRMGLQSSRGRH